jgi:hypothetical protein
VSVASEQSGWGCFGHKDCSVVIGLHGTSSRPYQEQPEHADEPSTRPASGRPPSPPLACARGEQEYPRAPRPSEFFRHPIRRPAISSQCEPVNTGHPPCPWPRRSRRRCDHSVPSSTPFLARYGLEALATARVEEGHRSGPSLCNRLCRFWDVTGSVPRTGGWCATARLHILPDFLDTRGVTANRHETWGGMRCTRRRRVRLSLQGGVTRVSDQQRRARRGALLRTVKAHGPGTRCWCQISRRHTQPNRDMRCHAIRGATVAR